MRITAEQLREELYYDPETGDFWWARPGIGRRLGRRAGRVRKGYWVIGLFGREYPASHLAWLHVTGGWPPDEIDHKDTITLNDRWSNLRPATCLQNHANTKAHHDNALGVKGVRRMGRKFQARLQVEGRTFCLGTFETLVGAQNAYASAAYKHFGVFARLG